MPTKNAEWAKIINSIRNVLIVMMSARLMKIIEIGCGFLWKVDLSIQ